MESEIEFKNAIGGGGPSTLFVQVRPDGRRKGPDGAWVGGVLLATDTMRELGAWLLAMAEKIDARNPKPCMHIEFTRVRDAADCYDSCDSCGAGRLGTITPDFRHDGAAGHTEVTNYTPWKGGNR